jgi:hypothetical protein
MLKGTLNFIVILDLVMHVNHLLLKIRKTDTVVVYKILKFSIMAEY